MKIYFLAFVCASSALAAADVSLPIFTATTKIPELSLAAALKSGQVIAPDAETRAVLAWMRSEKLNRRKFVSRMPVIPPSAEVDKNMPMVAPDPTKEFKIITITPQVELVK